jgi:hypothetical protein
MASKERRLWPPWLDDIRWQCGSVCAGREHQRAPADGARYDNGSLWGRWALLPTIGGARIGTSSATHGLLVWFMPRQPNHPTLQKMEQEEARRRSEAEAISRQSNVLPMDAARNEGRFYGQLLRGERPFTGVQRIGAFLVGSLFCCWAVSMIITTFPRLLGPAHAANVGNAVSVFYVFPAALAFLLGIMMIRRAVAPNRGK